MRFSNGYLKRQIRAGSRCRSHRTRRTLETRPPGKMQSPKWCRTNRQAWHRTLGDRGLSCPAGPTRNSANLLPCGRHIRLRKLPNGCTACARRYAGRQCGCAKRDCCRPIFPSISTSIRQSGRGRGRNQGSWQRRPHHRRRQPRDPAVPNHRDRLSPLSPAARDGQRSYPHD